MSYWETLLVILRRWRISVPAVLLAAGVGAGIFVVVPPSYEDTVQVLFLGSPNQPGEKAKVNPYLSLSSTLVLTAAVVQARLSTPQEVESLAALGATAQYVVIPDQSTPAPVLLLTTTSAHPAVATRTSQALVTEIQRILVDLQQSAGAPVSTWVNSAVISSLPEPKRKLNASIRPAITAAGGVFVLMMFVLFLFEGRRRRREQNPVPLDVPQHHPQAQPHPYPPLAAPATQPIPKLTPPPTLDHPATPVLTRHVPQLQGISGWSGTAKRNINGPADRDGDR